MNYRRLLPEGMVRIMDFGDRFRAMDLPSRWSLYRKYRQALDISLIELMPRKVVENLTNVVDVGANVGSWSTAIAQLTNAKHIYAYEPVPEVFEKLKVNTKSSPQIHCYCSAVGASNGKTIINVEAKSELSSIYPIRNEVRWIHNLGLETVKQISVPMVKLDDALCEIGEISLLKVDVQGYELEVFKGALQLLSRTKVLMTEITYQSNYEGDVQFFGYFEFLQTHTDMQLWAISAPKCSKTGIPMYADAVFVQEI